MVFLFNLLWLRLCISPIGFSIESPRFRWVRPEVVVTNLAELRLCRPRPAAALLKEIRMDVFQNPLVATLQRLVYDTAVR